MIVGIVVTALGLASAVLGLMALVPRVEVSFPSRLDPRRPLAANFTVKNVGTFPVYNVVCAYLARDVPNTIGVTFQNNGFTNADMRTQRLRPGDQYTFSVEKGIVFPPGAIMSAEIEVVAAAHPWGWPFKKKYFRAAYKTHKSEAGDVEWFAKPPSGPLPDGVIRILE